MTRSSLIGWGECSPWRWQMEPPANRAAARGLGHGDTTRTERGVESQSIFGAARGATNGQVLAWSGVTRANRIPGSGRQMMQRIKVANGACQCDCHDRANKAASPRLRTLRKSGN